jgi:hypothetical protein
MMGNSPHSLRAGWSIRWSTLRLELMLECDYFSLHFLFN